MSSLSMSFIVTVNERKSEKLSLKIICNERRTHQATNYVPLFKDQLVDENSLVLNTNEKMINNSGSFLNYNEANPNSVLVSQFQLETFLNNDCFMKKKKDELTKYIQALELNYKNLKEINLKIESNAQNIDNVIFQNEFEELKKNNDILYETGIFNKTVSVLNEACVYLSKACKQLRDVYSENCGENSVVKHDLETVEETLTYCDKTLKLLNTKNVSKVDLFYLWTKYADLEEMYRQLFNEVVFVKGDFEKQLYDIAEVLESFENVALHFSEMKKVFLEQQKAVCYKKDSLLKVGSGKNIEFNQLSKLNQCCQKSKYSNLAADSNIGNLKATRKNETVFEEKLESKDIIIKELRNEIIKYKIYCRSLKRMLSIEFLNMNEQIDEFEALKSEVGIWNPLHDKFYENLKKTEDLLLQLKINNRDKRKEETTLLRQYLQELEEDKARNEKTIKTTILRNKPSKNHKVKENNKTSKLIDEKKSLKKLSNKKKMSALLTENFSYNFQVKYLIACKELIRGTKKNVKSLNEKVCFWKSKTHKLISKVKRLQTEKRGLQMRLDDIEKDSFKDQEMNTYRELINQLSLKLKTKKEQLMESKLTIIKMEKLWETEQQEVLSDLREALNTDWSFYESTIV
ncbi:uncharacterized protein MCAP_0864-like isoform X2 [Hydra vulgaris]|uniref:Uncharacterized protein MCAP_0864-like isoform X2 n=1 Tax=Hydra vulgaris TaxID=6087 RepID=A0ABM4CC03_HYDVU